MRKEIIGNATLYLGNALTVLRALPDCSAHCCVTSPPYWGLRDYGAGQLGLESTPAEYVEKMVAVFREVRRVLRDDGTLWLNLGDSYAGGGNYRGINSENTLTNKQASNRGATGLSQQLGAAGKDVGLEPKNLIGIPWRVAFALQADGWYLRQDIIWSKPNPMPESVRDRCTKAHEYLFLLAKSVRYYYDAEAIQEPFVDDRLGASGTQSLRYSEESGRNGDSGLGGRPKSYRGSTFTQGKTAAVKPTVGQGEREEAAGRNKRSVWTVSTQPFKGAHFATFPPALIEPCILAGCPKGGTVLDPFMGSGTAGEVALENSRAFVGIELSEQYFNTLAMPRIENAQRQVQMFP